MTLAELAVASGVSVRTIGDLERGRSTARRSTLQALADALKLTDADRAALAEAAGAVRSADPSVLPRDVPDFTGRSAEVDLLTRCIGDGGRVVVHGPPGVGKTAQAVHVASRVPVPVTFRTGSSTTRPVSSLLVLDDVVDGSEVPPGPVVVTSRRPLTALAGAVRVALGPLRAAESVALLSTITGTPADAATSAVAGYCGHLPLALRIAGNRVAGRPGWTMADLAARLADESRRLQVLSAGDLSVENALAWSFARLSEPARRLCHTLAHTDTETFDVRRAAEAAGTDRVSAGQGLAELVDHGLLTVDGSGRYRYRALARTFARTRPHRR
jgi:hypothetical protein